MQQATGILLALALGITTGEPVVAGPAAVAGQTEETTAMGAQTAFDNLKAIPPGDVMRISRGRERAFDVFKEDIFRTMRETEQKLAELPTPKRQLAALYLVEDMAGDINLTGYFQLSVGGFAPQVLKVLEELDMQPQARVFSEAMALFGREFPTDFDTRLKYFSAYKVQTIIENTETPDEQDASTVEELDRLSQPGELEKKLDALSHEFRSGGTGYERALGAFIEKTPELIGWIEEIRPTLSEKERLYWLIGQMHFAFHGEEQRIDSWPKPYRQLYLLDWFEGETTNGGMHQFFFNSSGGVAPEVAETLREVGLIKMADAVQEGIDLFPKTYPVDTEERRKYLFNFLDPADMMKEMDSKLDQLTEAIYDGSTHIDSDHNPIVEAMIAIAKKENILPQ